MQNHEKRAFYKFFFIYFFSVASLILVAGFLYFTQMRNQYLNAEAYSVIGYARAIKMGNDLEPYKDKFSYIVERKNFKNFNIENFTRIGDEFIKYVPKSRGGVYFKISKSTKSFDKKVKALRYKIHLAQLLLLILFGFISYVLAKNAIKPLQQSISTLDKFIKDLIHDLNTPITAIKLNMKLLQKDSQFANNKALQRVNKGVHSISELHENLTILLQEETFQVDRVNIFNIVDEVVAMHKTLYPNINFMLEHFTLVAKTNPQALKQILQNIISNACKYNRKNGFVKIYTRGDSLYIQDSGKGIEKPEKIFERSFSGENSSGIGLDIVKRLASALNIAIDVKSSSGGTVFILEFD